MAGNNGYFTKVEKRILDVLSDGLPHRKEELHPCLSDELGPVTNAQRHISSIRKKIRPKGEDIVCELVARRINYRHVRLLRSVASE
jgi:hypothetical protein